ncbi:hypothetical protein CLV28_2727 [Sediminihabitans luteus]|uniref:Uncharacterized protein n=1 Tax=Sediminihabitans luteus TaxID=1138585 RepID=A0A2M9CD23_9CELL|nr:hypothetical protein [Sediminihabitans luteus]PJJ69264.1 hypothetical protein CLV28_2727 [Sediminihabitans luteus]GII98940.1 hypothetical protein Slu03_13180 [Sediminihabitans luteus]
MSDDTESQNVAAQAVAAQTAANEHPVPTLAAVRPGDVVTGEYRGERFTGTARVEGDVLSVGPHALRFGAATPAPSARFVSAVRPVPDLPARLGAVGDATVRGRRVRAMRVGPPGTEQSWVVASDDGAALHDDAELTAWTLLADAPAPDAPDVPDPADAPTHTPQPQSPE